MINPDEIGFIGDDVNDLEIMKRIGFSATPSYGIKEALKVVDYRCNSKGGGGAFREIVDLLIQSKLGTKKLF